MNVLLINKFLYPKGGAETYTLKLGGYLQLQGHSVQYFGMDQKGRCVGNRANAYTSDMDFHGGPRLAKLAYPAKIIYSSEAREKIRRVLDDFRPDVCHLNNFNYQLTPSVILEIVRWRDQARHPCRIIYTAHDYNLICPNRLLYNPVVQSSRGGFSPYSLRGARATLAAKIPHAPLCIKNAKNAWTAIL